MWGAASKLTDQLSWEAIPKEELDRVRAHGLAEAERLLRQDRQPIWASSQKFQDVRKLLKLSQQFMQTEAAEKVRQEADAVASPLMPDQLNGKVLTATLKNGKAICPSFRQESVRIRLMSALSASIFAPSFRSQAEPVEGSMGRASAPSRGQSRRPQLCQLLQIHQLLWYLQPWVTRQGTVYQEESSS